MLKKKSIGIIIEICIFPLIIFAINLFFSDNPGFLKGSFNLYLILALIVAAQHGKNFSLLSIGISAGLILGPFPLLQAIIQSEAIDGEYWLGLAKSAPVPFSAALLTSFLVGVIRDARYDKWVCTRKLLQKVGRKKGILQRELKALKIVNSELEKRVLTQRDSINALYSRIQKLYNTNFKKSLEIIIDTIQIFTEASSCSIWEYDQAQKCLKLLLESGWSKSESLKTTIDADNSIEGWVVRNNIIFSAKMLIQYDNLRQMDVGRNIYTVPILAGQKIWGVLNIEKLPFEKYNLYTEKILLVIMALVAPALERSIEYENLHVQDTVNPQTGLPLFSQFFMILEKEIARLKREQGTLSIVVLELINYEQIQQEILTKNECFILFMMISEGITELSQNKTIFFHYKSDNQLCLIYPHLDYDGCSLFCLNLLEMINSKEWVIHDRIIYPEMILGYSSLGKKDILANDLINMAENLLDMQKV